MKRAALFAALLWRSASLADEISGLVISVSDGDTLKILTAEVEQVTVRLSGIDAPEKAQAFGNASKKALVAAAHKKQAIVHWDKRDRYGRIVGRVMVDGQDVNLQQIVAGLAWHYKRYESEQPPEERAAYAQAEEAARAAGAGLWADPEPVPPWEFRKKDSAK